MSNFLQYSHKMARHQLSALNGLEGETLLAKITELAGKHGSVHSVKKMGEESYQNYRRKLYLVAFDKADEAKNAASSLDGIMFSKTSMILMLN